MRGKTLRLGFLGGLAFGLALSLGFGTAVWAHPADVIDNFAEVSPGIYRGANPGAVGLQELKALGVQTIVNLRSDSEENKWEEAYAEALGMQYISITFYSFWFPDDQDVEDVLSVLKDSSRYPIFVHCLHGRDRTGLVIGFHRVFNEGWRKGRAYAEMKAYGFREAIIPLRLYWLRKTQGMP